MNAATGRRIRLASLAWKSGTCGGIWQTKG